MTRHELKDQLSHDQFSDGVSAAVGYAVSHRQKVTRFALIAGVLLLLIGAGIWFASYRRDARQQDLRVALDVLEAEVGPPKPNNPMKNFPTQDAKDQALMKAFSGVVDKDGNSKEGLVARYYRGTVEAEKQDLKAAESDLKIVADSSSDFAALAKVALANLYAGQGKVSDARSLLQGLVNKPTDLISKDQAQLLLAQLEADHDPQQAKRLLNAMKSPAERPAITRAVDQLSAQLPH